MIGKPWEQRSVDEKIEVLRQQIAELFWRGHTNVIISNQEFAKIWEKIEALEKRLDQVDKGGAARQQDGT
jgi:hypothetical protein